MLAQSLVFEAARTKKHGAWGKEQGARSKGQGARGKEQGAWSKGHGARSMEKRSEVSVQPGVVGWVERLFDRRVSPFH